MNRDISHITIYQIEPSAELSCTIISQLNALQYARYRRNRMVFGIISTASILGVVPAFVVTVTAFADSNFGSYSSLILSDSAIIFSFWKELGLSLIESVPIGNVVLTTSLVTIGIWSMRHTPIRSRFSYHTSNA